MKIGYVNLFSIAQWVGCGLSSCNNYQLFSLIIPETRLHHLATPQRC